MMDKAIIPECYADTLLIQTLVSTTKGYNHQHSCYKVEATMRRIEGFALGIIDNDKQEIAYLKDFELFDRFEDDLYLWRHKDRTRHHWIIQLSPALERWVITVCGEEGIDLSDFGKDVFMGLKKHTKSRVSLKDPKLISIFNAIASTENLRVRKLRNWVSKLKEQNYNIDLNDLRDV